MKKFVIRSRMRFHAHYGLAPVATDVPQDSIYWQAQWSDTPFSDASGPLVRFGPCAFKYQPQPNDLIDAVRECAATADVITTSGPATGQPPTLDKVLAIRAAAGGHPLAIASGITADNAPTYLPHVDAILVATGVELEFGRFSRTALADLMARVNDERARRVRNGRT